MNNSLLAVAALVLSGCGLFQQAGHAPSDAPVVLNKDFRREYHQEFSPLERDMILIAKKYLARSGKWPRSTTEDAYYRVRHTGSGYEVFVIYVTGYDGPRPLLEPCLHQAVMLREDGLILGVLTGPECWP